MHFNIPGPDGIGREVALVVGQDQLRMGADGRRQNVTVARMVCHRVDEGFKSFYTGFGKMAGNFVLASSCFVDGHTPRGDEIPSYLLHDPLRPLRQE